MSELFKRKSIKKDSIGYYNLEEENDAIACGLEDPKSSTFVKRNSEFFDKLNEVTSNGMEGNPVAVVSEIIEERFNSREISFLLSKTILMRAFELESEEEEKE